MKTEKFTKEEIRALKEMAQEKLRFERIFLYDENGKKIPYRNRFETWEDAHTNLRAMGMSEEEIIKQIGKKKKHGTK